MSSIIRSRSGVVLSSVMGTSCLMIEKTPIVSQDRKPTNARRSDHCCTLATGRQCRASGFV
ncbi:hypothetical protein, partial [Mesorhizobium sp. M0019]|uniref:hypothetical protein n=1 Tax=Mesorhizobium sp. M0019 TaxID=2956845 RepID=UPI003336C36E